MSSAICSAATPYFSKGYIQSVKQDQAHQLAGSTPILANLLFYTIYCKGKALLPIMTTSRELKGPTTQGLICKQTALRTKHDSIAKN